MPGTRLPPHEGGVRAIVPARGAGATWPPPASMPGPGRFPARSGPRNRNAARYPGRARSAIAVRGPHRGAAPGRCARRAAALRGRGVRVQRGGSPGAGTRVARCARANPRTRPAPAKSGACKSRSAGSLARHRPRRSRGSADRRSAGYPVRKSQAGAPGRRGRRAGPFRAMGLADRHPCSLPLSGRDS